MRFSPVIFASLLLLAPLPARAAMDDYPVAKLQSLDKTSARTMVFEANVGSTVRFGSLYIKIQACRKAPPIEAPEAAAFLQVWETEREAASKWIFSGWMFASSPALSAMEHPVYDVWVIDCLESKTGKPAAAAAAPQSTATPVPSEAEIEKNESLEAAPDDTTGDTADPATAAPAETTPAQ